MVLLVFSRTNENQCDGVCNVPPQMQWLHHIIPVTISIILVLLYTAKRRHQYQRPCQVLDAKIAAKREFITRNKDHYGYPNSKKGFIDDWRLQEFPSLLPPLEQQQPNVASNPCAVEPEVYLDYAGSALPTRSQLLRIYEESVTNSTNGQILANPHSLGGGIASDRTWKLMQQSIHCVMKHFGVDDEYIDLDDESNDGSGHIYPGYRLVFTSGATESLRLVAEHFPWSFMKFSPSIDHELLLDTVSTNIQQCPVDSVKVKSLLVYLRNSHTSVIGMRNVALNRGAQFRCMPIDELLNASSAWFQSLTEQSIEVEESATSKFISTIEEKKQTDTEDVDEPNTVATETIWVHNLLVLPIECNFSGDRFDWANTVAAAQSSFHTTYLTHRPINSDAQVKVIKVCHKWHVLLDTAKAAATSEVNLPAIVPNGPDFAVVSFYKLFGHPTGLGALFIRKHHGDSKQIHTHGDVNDDLDPNILNQANTRHYFGGGSVDIVLPHLDFTVPRSSRRPSSDILIQSKRVGIETLDFGPLTNGTQHFRGIAELIHGFQEIGDIGGMSRVSLHSTCLAAELVRRFKLLHHDNGKPVVCICSQWKSFETFVEDIKARSLGPTVAFNVCDRDGAIVGYDEVSRLASLNQPPIQLRTGCFCNPGACQDALMLTDEELIENWRGGHVCGDRRGIVNGRPTGCIRASFGKDSIWEDMDALVSFLDKTFVFQKTASIPENFSQYSTSSHFSIESIYVFPIKSCAAMQVRRWPIESSTGKFLFDREFALVDASGVAMRLSSYPKMIQIQPTIDMSTSTITISAPEHVDLTLSLEKSGNSTVSSKDVEVCGILCSGNIWGGREASNSFTSVLGVRCWLARHKELDSKKVSPDRMQHNHTSYSNEAALLLVSMQSVNVLNSVIQAQGWGRQVDARHFRPNIVVKTDEINHEAKGSHHPEDTWERIIMRGESGQVELSAAGKCARCQMVDIDPTSGMKGNTLRALAQYRRERGRIYFGTFFSGLQSITIGEEVVWLEVGGEVRAVNSLEQAKS